MFSPDNIVIITTKRLEISFEGRAVSRSASPTSANKIIACKIKSNQILPELTEDICPEGTHELMFSPENVVIITTKTKKVGYFVSTVVAVSRSASCSPTWLRPFVYLTMIN